ncbi:MAG: aminoglycoside phosphotransferase family protein [Acidobacteriota bacterium]
MNDRGPTPGDGSDPEWKWPRLDHASAGALLAGRLPAGLDGGLEPIGQGDFCLAFRSRDRVVRVARHGAAAVALRREACVLAAIAGRLPVAVPRPTHHEPEGCPPFSVHTEIIGSVLTRSLWESMPGMARRRAASDLAAFLLALHHLPPALGSTCGLTRVVRSEQARRLRDPSARRLAPLLDGPPRRALARALQQAARVEAETPDALLHGDIAPGHLLCDPASGRLSGVIDFGDLVIGEPARDFIYLYEDFGPAVLADVVSEYEDRDPAALVAAIRSWYLIEAVDWTLRALAGQRNAEVAEGLAAIQQECDAGP